MKRHKKGYVTATKARLPINLDFYVAFGNKTKAFNFEKYLKFGSGRAFIKKHFYLVRTWRYPASLMSDARESAENKTQLIIKVININLTPTLSTA